MTASWERPVQHAAEHCDMQPGSTLTADYIKARTNKLRKLAEAKLHTKLGLLAGPLTHLKGLSPRLSLEAFSCPFLVTVGGHAERRLQTLVPV